MENGGDYWDFLGLGMEIGIWIGKQLEDCKGILLIFYLCG